MKTGVIGIDMPNKDNSNCVLHFGRSLVEPLDAPIKTMQQERDDAKIGGAPGLARMTKEMKATAMIYGEAE